MRSRISIDLDDASDQSTYKHSIPLMHRFGEKYIFPKSSLTGYKRHGSGAETYDLYTLVYFLKQPPNTPWLAYVRSARESGVPQVAFPDRKVLGVPHRYRP